MPFRFQKALHLPPKASQARKAAQDTAVLLPGRGLSYQRRIPQEASFSNTRWHAGSAGELGDLILKIAPDGSARITDTGGAPVDETKRRIALNQHAQKIYEALRAKADTLNATATQDYLLHRDLPFSRAGAVSIEDALPKPTIPTADRFEEAFASFTAQLGAWRQATAAPSHQPQQTDLKAPIDALAMIEKGLRQIPWPRAQETLASMELRADGRKLMLDIEAPEIAELPQQFAMARLGHLSLAHRQKAPASLYKDYETHIHSLCLRLLAEAFSHVPQIKTVVLSVFIEPSHMTAASVSGYLCSVRTHRTEWENLDLSSSSLNVVHALENFDLRRQMSRSGYFHPVEPYIE